MKREKHETEQVGSQFDDRCAVWRGLYPDFYDLPVRLPCRSVPPPEYSVLHSGHGREMPRTRNTSTREQKAAVVQQYAHNRDIAYCLERSDPLC